MPKKGLDELGAGDVIKLMDKADMRAMKAVKGARKEIAEAARAAADAIGDGGRLIYIGSGSSGRLGVLDASECPPTFSAPYGQVVGVIAGGAKALRRAVEGAEDDRAAGIGEMRKLDISARDMVVGISASGTTPYVIAALLEARKRGAAVWLLRCSPGGSHAGIRVILTDTGPEVIRGSTRLAAGTATKLVLNRITTAAYVMLGKVHGELMVDVMPTNAKLVRRAVGIIMEVTGCAEARAAVLLEASGGSAKVAAVMELLSVDRQKARLLLKAHSGSLRDTISSGDGR